MGCFINMINMSVSVYEYMFMLVQVFCIILTSLFSTCGLYRDRQEAANGTHLLSVCVIVNDLLPSVLTNGAPKVVICVIMSM